MSELALETTDLQVSNSEANGLLEQARERAAQDNLPFAGTVTPTEAWSLVQQGLAKLIDVRSAEERKFVGHIPETLHVAWATGLSLNKNPRFVRDLEKQATRSDVILFLCRSGKRSALAAQEATKAGFQNAFNILDGFEGELNEQQQRGGLGGWRQANLPWIQD